jgi:hypothetical protein
MPFLVGMILALSIGLSASLIGLDRDRAFYPTVMIVIASYYALFAVMGGSVEVLAPEAIPIAVFVVASIAGFKYSLWLVVTALVAHGVFDVSHGQLIINPGVPTWWPNFCLGFDVVAGLYLAWLLKTNRLHARANDCETTKSLLEQEL